VGAKRFEGVRFSVWTNDHTPRHVHGDYAEVEAKILLLQDGTVELYAVKPSNLNRADIRHVLAVAESHHSELVDLWEQHHGKEAL
jgi:Domain of unknown function (DUF4160)